MNNYVKHRQEDKVIDPSSDRVYVQGKMLRQEKAEVLQTNLTTVPNLNGCMKGANKVLHSNKLCVL